MRRGLIVSLNWVNPYKNPSLTLSLQQTEDLVSLFEAESTQLPEGVLGADFTDSGLAISSGFPLKAYLLLFAFTIFGRRHHHYLRIFCV